MSMSKLTVKIVKPFMYNGTMVRTGQDIEMNFGRAVRHMRVGDIERNESAIKQYKLALKSEAEAKLKDAESDW